GTIALFFYISSMTAQVQEAFIHFLGGLHTFTITPNSVYSLAIEISQRIALLILPILCFIALVGFLTARIQVGKLWTTEVFKFKWEKFNIIKGVQRLFFTTESFVRLGKSIVQACIIAIAPYIVLKDKYKEFIVTYHATPYQTGAFLLETAFTMMQYTLIPMLLLMFIDIFYTRYKYKENIKMTKQEVKDEYKQVEGDVALKQRMRKKMRDLIGRKVEQLIPTADVVITNPTHFAVALKYDPNIAPAPIVIAKGKGYRAKKIKELARIHGVPIKENKPLAQALYKTLEIGDVIPEEMYHAVALILSSLAKFKRPNTSNG
ncbi:MAG: flagellar type III secretion system protein FlhB, partial [Desulfovibrionaceae bacterium]|nr:flagellar type III secretion system protein FlhB [Desulfovibrionaceae bacterium]